MVFPLPLTPQSKVKEPSDKDIEMSFRAKSEEVLYLKLRFLMLTRGISMILYRY